MRDWSVRFLILIAILFVGGAAAGCETTPPLTVVKLSKGEQAEDVKGDPVKLKRPDQEVFAGGKPGYRVIRSHDDWNAAWPTGQVPDLPEALRDQKRVMGIFATSESKSTLSLKVKKAVETAEMIFIWVSEQKLGENCIRKQANRAFELVTAPRLDKPVRFYVQSEPGESCGPPPVASAEKTPCQPNGMKPPPAVKFPPLKRVPISATIASTGIAIFHAVIGVFDFASQRTPSAFTTVKSAISTTATPYPCVVSTVSPPDVFVSHGR